jgi:hypothetical protein
MTTVDVVQQQHHIAERRRRRDCWRGEYRVHTTRTLVVHPGLLQWFDAERDDLAACRGVLAAQLAGVIGPIAMLQCARCHYAWPDPERVDVAIRDRELYGGRGLLTWCPRCRRRLDEEVGLAERARARRLARIQERATFDEDLAAVGHA